MNQREFIYNYNNKYREKFNKTLFNRSDDMIIYYLKNIIKSAERQMGVNGYFTIKIHSFRVVDEYTEVLDILRQHQARLISKNSKKGPTDNKYDYIDIKDSDLKLLIVTYYVEASDGREMFDVIIAVPRVIEKFYFKINGNIRTPMYQIVDAFTYNNKTSTDKYQTVTAKSTFQPIRIYKNIKDAKDIHDEEVSMITFNANIFNKTVPIAKYIFAEMGLIRGLQFLRLDNFIRITDEDPNDPEWYTFLPKKTSQIYINCPKSLLYSNLGLQHIMGMMCDELGRKFAVLPDIFSKKYWLDSLGRHFNMSDPINKAISVLTSLKLIYDRTTAEKIRLPEQDKNNIFSILRWAIYEYDMLLLKNNLDISIKRLRCEEYIASFYSPRFSKAIYALSDMGEKVDIQSIKRRLTTDPMYLINEITNSNLVNFRDITTDNDSYLSIKCTYKGIAGIGEAGSNSIPDIYRYCHTSNIGIVDMSASSPTDPGVTSMLVPLINVYPEGYFRDDPKSKEPNTWKRVVDKQLREFKKESKLKEVIEFDKKTFKEPNYDIPELQQFHVKKER